MKHEMKPIELPAIEGHDFDMLEYWALNALSLIENYYQPYAYVLLLSGGNDSMASHAMCKKLGIPVDFTFHLHTGCGIEETTDFVRSIDHLGRFEVLSAGSKYKERVLSRGFFGKGRAAHNMAFHVLKKTPLVRGISAHIRKRKRNRRVVLINGARKQESQNRMEHLEPIKIEGSNIWFNIMHYMDNKLPLAYMDSEGIRQNPVSAQLCRSGECMCGTTQSLEERIEAAYHYPAWGKWIDNLDKLALKNNGTQWGKATPKELFKDKAPANHTPLCQACEVAHNPNQLSLF